MKHLEEMMRDQWWHAFAECVAERRYLCYYRD